MMMLQFLKPEIMDLVRHRNWDDLKDILNEWPAQDIAVLISGLDNRDAMLLFRLLSRSLASQVFAWLDPGLQEKLILTFGDRELCTLILDMPADDRTRLFDDLPAEVTQKLLNLLPQKARKEALVLLGYPERSVGRLLTPDFVSVLSDWSVEQAIGHIRSVGKDAETINMVYVTDENQKLLDDIPIRRFLLSGSGQSVTDLMDDKFIAIEAAEDQEHAVQLMKHYDLNVLPVIDASGLLLGIVTIDDMIDVLEQEVTEDFHKGAAVSPVSGNYIQATPFHLYKKRIGWLLLLLVANFLSSAVISHFEYALQTVLALAFFIPVLIDSGGNTASQSSTLIIRAIATGELGLKQWFAVIRKELLVGLLLGVSLGVVIYFRSVFWKSGADVGLVVGLSLVMVMLWANLLGSVLPIILTRLKLDPAVISSPLLTTIIDASGLLIYFSIAKAVLNL
ncbi:magnesium transporter [bacterium]|nr:magnesium transporter [bacterium]